VDRRKRLLFWLASPSAFFVLVNVAGELGMSRIHRRIALLYGGQPGATVVLVSALAALAVALHHLVEVRAGDGHLSLKIHGSYRAVLGLVLASLAFTWLYIREFAWQYSFLY
jgi:hypothetical protein